MKKSIVGMFLISASTIAAAMSSVIPLGGGGVVTAATSISIPLTGLVPAGSYSVVCYISTSFPFQYIQLGSTFGDPTSSIISYSLNGNYVTQAQLVVGQNIAVINGTFTTPATGYLTFTNLDQVNSFNVTNCFGVPIQVTLS